jgi:hypothetical protein
MPSVPEWAAAQNVPDYQLKTALQYVNTLASNPPVHGRTISGK